TPNASLSICSGSSVQVEGPVGFTSYQWYKDGNVQSSTGQQIAVSEAATYAIAVGDGTCFSATSDAITVTIDTPPAKPVISGSHSICGTGSITLTAPASTGYQWSTTETSQSISVAAGTYTLTVVEGSCSAVSDPFIVSVVTIPGRPEITVK